MIQVTKFGSGKPLSLIHGWGAQNAVWQDWAETHLAAHFEVHLIELPGFGQSDAIPTQAKEQQLADEWTQAIVEVLPNQGNLLGWSLGGLMAQNIALHAPEKVDKLICLASTPRFTQGDHWQGAVSPKLMADFIKSIQADSLATLKSFWTLQMQGSEIPRLQIKQFLKRMQSYQPPTMKGLLQGLQLLKHFDFREDAEKFNRPVLWLLGENDPLIAQVFICEFSKIQPQAEARVIQGASHTPFASHPLETAQAIIEFLQS